MRMDEVVNKKWKWIVAFMLCVLVLVGKHLQNTGQINVDVQKIVYSSEDLTMMRGLLRELFGEEQQTKITVSTVKVNQEMLTFTSIKPYYEGYLLTYEQALPIVAINHGVVVYTGHSKDTGKTISVYYEDDTTITFGFVDSFSILPYTSIQRGDTIGNKEEGDLYIQIETDGNILSLEQTLQWLKEHS